MPCMRTPAQNRTLQWADKENASPNIATPSRIPAKPGNPRALEPEVAKELGKTVSPEGTGTKNRFGYVPTSPATPVEVKETVKPKAFTVDLSADDARQAGRGQSSKDLIKNLTCADRSESPPLQAPSRTVECGGLAMTIAWTPPKNVKKPVLAERKPAASKRSLEKVPALVSKPSIACPKSKTVPKQVAVGKAMGIKSAACKAAEKKAVEVKKSASHTTGAKASRASLAPKAAAKTKPSLAARRKTIYADKWAEADNEVASVTGAPSLSIAERLQQIRIEHGCSLGAARQIMWKQQWGDSSVGFSEQDVCLAPPRPESPTGEQFSDDYNASDIQQRPRSAPSSPDGKKHDQQQDLASVAGSTTQVGTLKTPNRRHSLLYSPSFAKMRGGLGPNHPADVIKRATGGTAPARASPLAELDTSDPLGEAECSTPPAAGKLRGATASPIGISPQVREHEGWDESFESAPESLKGTPAALVFHEGRQASPSPPSSPAREDKESQVVEKIVTVQVPGPERILEVIKEVPVEKVVIKEVPVYVDRVVECDRVVTTIKEVPVDRVVISEVGVPVDRVVEKQVEVPVERVVEVVKEVEVIREIEVEKIVEVEPVGLRTQLESCIEERELLRKQRHELEVERDQHLKQYQDTREELTAMASEASTLKAELSSLQQERALLATDVEHAAASLTAKTAQFAELKATKEGADLEIESLKQQLAAAGDAEKDVAAKLAVVENEEEALKRDLAATETMLGKMKERCDCADAALEASNKQLGQLEERYAASVAELARAEEGLRAETEARSKLEGQYDATLKDFQEQMLRTAERDEEIQALLQDKKDLEVEAQQLRASLSEAEAAAVAGNDERLVLQDKLAAAEARLEQVASRVEVLEVEKAEGMQAQQDLVVLQGQLQAAKDDLKRLQATESDSARAAQKTTDEVRLLTEKLEKCEVVALETSASHASAIRTVKEQLLEALAERKSARSASVELTAALEEKEQHVARLEAELAEGREASQEEVRLLAEKLEKCEAEVVVLKEQLLGAQAEANGARSASVELTTALEEKGQRVVRLENELEKAATRVVYEQVIKEVEVPVIREVVKEVEVIKEVYLPAVQTTSIPGPSRLRTFAKVAAVVALGASAIVTSVALMDNGTCPVPKWNYGVGHPLVQASRGVRSHDKALQKQIKELQAEMVRRNNQLNAALAAQSDAQAGKMQVEAAAATMQETAGALEQRLRAESKRASAADLLAQQLEGEVAAARAKETQLKQELQDLRAAAKKQVHKERARETVSASGEWPWQSLIKKSAGVQKDSGSEEVDSARALKQFGAYAGSVW